MREGEGRLEKVGDGGEGGRHSRVKVTEKGWEFIKRKKDTYADSRM